MQLAGYAAERRTFQIKLGEALDLLEDAGAKYSAGWLSKEAREDVLADIDNAIAAALRARDALVVRQLSRGSSISSR